MRLGEGGVDLLLVDVGEAVGPEDVSEDAEVVGGPCCVCGVLESSAVAACAMDGPCC